MFWDFLDVDFNFFKLSNLFQNKRTRDEDEATKHFKK